MPKVNLFQLMVKTFKHTIRNAKLMENIIDADCKSMENMKRVAVDWSKEFAVNDETIFHLLHELRQGIIDQQRHARDVSLLRVGPGAPDESYKRMVKYCFLADHEHKNSVLQAFKQTNALFTHAGLTDEQKSRVVKAFYLLFGETGCKCSKGS